MKKFWTTKFTTWDFHLQFSTHCVLPFYRVRSLATFLAAGIFLSTLPVHASIKNINKIVNFDITKDTADSSLVRFAQQANITLLFPLDLVNDISTNSLKGWFSVEDGINALLKETNLVAEVDDSGQITIVVKKRLESIKVPSSDKTNTEIPQANLDNSTDIALSQETKNKNRYSHKYQEDKLEVISVKGVRGSIIDSINDKRYSMVIKDSISAEDIGQLPDENIAEALQRMPGVQMSRAADGEGTSVQIRGISDNNVEINGLSVTGSAANRNINFQDIPSELFSGIEVYKAPTANQIEGSLGGTINLKTRKPLNIKNDQVGSVTARVKYSDLINDIAPDLNGFFAKNFRSTDWGSFGFLVNIASKEVITQTDALGGGDFANAPAQWFRRTGAQRPAGDDSNNQFLADGPIQYFTGPNAEGNATFGLDVNADGIVDENDRYYVPGGIRLYSRKIDSSRDSINTSFQWQPYDDLNIYLEYSRADSEEQLNGSQLALTFNAARSFPIMGADVTLSTIGDNAYLIDSGLIGATSLRLGGAPSERVNTRIFDNLTFSTDYDINEDIRLALLINRSSGSSSTSQAQLNMGYDWDNDGEINASDFAGIVQYDFTQGTFPNATLYESPRHPANGFNSPTSFSELVTLDPTDLDYDRLSYFQMQRNANDTENENGSLSLDLTYVLDGAFFTQLAAGIHVADQEFSRRAFINSNQSDSVFTSNGQARTIDIQKVKVNPEANNNPLNASIAIDLQACLGTTSIDLEGSNLPTSWTTTLCNSDFFTDYYNLLDIRAVDPASGAGYYEITGSRYNVKEETRALYLMADFETEVAGFLLFGNAGVRYIETETTSTGYLQNPTVLNEPISYSLTSLLGEYTDTLPSMNINWSINEPMLIRFAAYKALGRPRLSQLSPGIQLNFNPELDEYAGTADLGNPDLDPIRSSNYDLSYEWYYKNDSMFSAAIFVKNLESVIFADAANTSEIEIAGELFISTQPQNQEGTKIKGYELNLQHSFSHLNGLLSHSGFIANYTHTSENTDNIDQEGDPIGRAQLSEDSCNIVAYYDDNNFSIRLAYNWRVDFVRRPSVELGFNRPEALPEIEKGRGQLDLSANYELTSNLKINFSAVNLNNSKTERFIKYNQLTNYIGSAGTRYNLGFVYRF